MNLSGNGTGSLSWWTLSTTRAASPMGCEARVEGRTGVRVRERRDERGETLGLRTGGKVDQHGALASLAVFLMRVLPVLFLDPLCEETVHESAHDRRGLAGVPAAKDAL